jgi:hypothetical protein
LNNLLFKRVLPIVLFLLSTIPAWACPVCERNQPKVLKGVVHGQAGSQWDYLIVWIVVGITLISLYLSVKWLIRPGERNPDHIKYSILNEENYE